MIISASRRTDLPAFYAPWFEQRLQEGYVLVRNPRQPGAVSRVSLSPKDVDCFVFWSKNPQPLLPVLRRHPDLPFYFQFTLNGYGPEVEPGIPPLSRRLETARWIAEHYGPERLVLRLDPILRSGDYPASFYPEFLGRIAESLGGQLEECVFSFLDSYTHIAKRLAPLRLLPLDEDWQREVVRGLREVAQAAGIRLSACAEAVDFSDLGVSPARCVDPQRIGRILGHPLRTRKDPGQRPACGCAASVDIGAYHCCGHFCTYCYANVGEAVVRRNIAGHLPDSPFLTGKGRPGDEIRDRK